MNNWIPKELENQISKYLGHTKKHKLVITMNMLIHSDPKTTLYYVEKLDEAATTGELSILHDYIKDPQLKFLYNNVRMKEKARKKLYARLNKLAHIDTNKINKKNRKNKK